MSGSANGARVIALAESSGLILILVGVFLLLVVGFVWAAVRIRRPRPETGPDIPKGMRPGPSDPALETPLLQKLQGWGVVLVAFFAIFIPYNWLREPSENLKQGQDLLTESIDRGRRSVQLFSEENGLGVGCVRCHGIDLTGGIIQSGDSFAYPPNLTNICAGPFGTPPHTGIASQDDIYQVIQEGRPPDDPVMPSWSIRFKGALDDQQIQDLVNYLIDLSSKNVPDNQNVCLNEDASERATELAKQNGVVLERP